MKLLENLTNKEKSLLIIKSFKKNQILFHEGDKCNEIGIVTNGELEISSYSLSGTKIVYNHLNFNSIFGNNLVFSSDNTYKGNIVSVIDSTVVLIKKENLLQLLKNEEFLKEYLRIQSDFGKILNQKLKISTFPSSEEKLFYLLKENNGKVPYKSITQLSEKLYLTRESTSRMIHKLIKENKILKSKNFIILKGL